MSSVLLPPTVAVAIARGSWEVLACGCACMVCKEATPRKRKLVYFPRALCASTFALPRATVMKLTAFQWFELLFQMVLRSIRFAILYGSVLRVRHVRGFATGRQREVAAPWHQLRIRRSKTIERLRDSLKADA